MNHYQNYPHHQGREGTFRANQAEAQLPSWKLDLNSADLAALDKICMERGKEFKNIKTHQIRSFFGGVNRLKNKRKKGASETDLRNHLIRMHPSLAYAKGRFKDIEPMYNFFVHYIDQVVNASGEKFFQNLEKFIFIAEAIVAYHRFYGGKD